MKVFLDTEFTGLGKSAQLISIGLVTAGDETFYAEVPFELDRCNQFVREVVLPLLDPACRCTAADLRSRLMDWVLHVRPEDEPLEVCFDFERDWDLFCAAIGEKNLPAWCARRKIYSRNINQLMRLDFFQRNNLAEHHALNDALALKYAFRNNL